MAEGRKLRMGMVGGGPGAFKSARFLVLFFFRTAKSNWVAGALSQSAERSREAGVRFGIDPARAYVDYRQMIEAERKRPVASTSSSLPPLITSRCPFAQGGLWMRAFR